MKITAGFEQVGLGTSLLGEPQQKVENKAQMQQAKI